MEVEGTPWRSGPGQTVCRCCLAEGCYKDISTEYFWMGKREVYSEMLIETFDVNIGFATNSGPNSNSRLICEPCIARLRDASEFKRQVQDCEKMFMQQLEPGSSSSVLELDGTQSGKAVKMEVVKIEKVDSDDDDFDRGGDDSDDDLDDEPLTKFATKVPKKESMDILELLDDPKPTKRKVSVKVKTPPVKKVKVKVPTKTTPKASSSKTATKAVVVKADKKKKDDGLLVERRNAEIMLLCTTAYPFRLPEISMQCVYCATSFAISQEFRDHMRAEHDTFNIDTAFNHCRWYEGYLKVDITELSCRLCFQPFPCLQTIAKHLLDVHEQKLNFSFDLGVQPYRLKDEKRNCVFCDKNFAGLRQLSRHLPTHYPKFTCETCGKSYISKPALKQHLYFGHRGDAYICRKCRERFSTVELYKRHMVESKACWMHLCQICGERFRGWHLKDQHMKQVHGQNKKYPCPECEQVFPHRKLMRVHFKFAHTDDALVCSYCGQKFDYKRDLDDHIVVHTQEKLYPCQVCTKSFARKKSLEQHMWIHREQKRFECVPCDKKFNQRVSWRTHMKSHHPEQGVQ